MESWNHGWILDLRSTNAIGGNMSSTTTRSYNSAISTCSWIPTQEVSNLTQVPHTFYRFIFIFSQFLLVTFSSLFFLCHFSISSRKCLEAEFSLAIMEAKDWPVSSASSIPVQFVHNTHFWIANIKCTTSKFQSSRWSEYLFRNFWLFWLTPRPKGPIWEQIVV